MGLSKNKMGIKKIEEENDLIENDLDHLVKDYIVYSHSIDTDKNLDFAQYVCSYSDDI